MWVDEYDTLVHWPKGRRHLLRRALVITVVDTSRSSSPPGCCRPCASTTSRRPSWSRSWPGLLTFLLRPVAFLVLRQSIVITAVLTVLFMGVTLQLAQFVVDGVTIDGWFWAFVTALLVAAVNMLLIGLLGLDEDESFYRNTLKKLARVARRRG